MVAHSPKLNQELRSRERAALDIAVSFIQHVVRRSGPHGHGPEAQQAIRKIGGIIPEAVPGRGENQPNTG